MKFETPKAESEPIHETTRLFLEDVADNIVRIHRQGREHHHVPANASKLLHKEIDDTELKDLFNQYENGHTLTFSHLDEAIAILVNLIKQEKKSGWGEEYSQQLEETEKLLSSRGRELRLGAQRYVGTLVKFVHISKQRIRLDPEEFKERMERADRERRIAHDGIIASLKTYNDLIYTLEQDDFFVELPYRIVEWSPGQPVPAHGKDVTEIPLFSPRFLADRDMVKNWAICANLHEMLSDIAAIEEEIKKAPHTEM